MPPAPMEITVAKANSPVGERNEKPMLRGNNFAFVRFVFGLRARWFMNRLVYPMGLGLT
jgi:hypothetical protein